MSNAGTVSVIEWLASSVSIPASGSSAVGVDPQNHLWTRNSSGSVWMPGRQSSATSDIAVTADAILVSTVVPVGLLQAGTSIRGTIQGTCTPPGGGGGSNAYNIFLLVDGLPKLTLTAGLSSATGTNIPFSSTWIATIAATGTTASFGRVNMVTCNQGTTGVINAVSTVDADFVPGENTFDSTTATLLQMKISTGLGQTYTITSASLELLAV